MSFNTPFKTVWIIDNEVASMIIEEKQILWRPSELLEPLKVLVLDDVYGSKKSNLIMEADSDQFGFLGSKVKRPPVR